MFSSSAPSSAVITSVSSEKSSAYIMLVELIEVILSTNAINQAYILFLIVFVIPFASLKAQTIYENVVPLHPLIYNSFKE